MMERKRYIGDGVYVEHDGWSLVLTTEDGISRTNRIVVEPNVYDSLQRFVEDLVAETEAHPPLGDCESCDGYVLNADEAPLCPTCARAKREAVK